MMDADTEYTISISWSTEDVKKIAPDLTYDEMCEVLDRAADNHDANYGITWETLFMWADVVKKNRR